MLDSIFDFIAGAQILKGLRALLFLVVGFLLARFVSRLVQRVTTRRFSVHHAALFRRAAFYLILGLFLASALRELGFSLGVLLGAAGVLSVAIGFASQTSASNLISGLFLIGERPFSTGDMIRVGNTTGEVLSVDLLSVKLRTFDNLYVRIPNETLIKTEVTTLTRFPIRRFDLQVGVAYKEDIERVRKVLMEVADKNPLCLDEPKPLFIFNGFGDSSLNIQFSVWAKRENFLELRNSMQLSIKRAFDEAGIEIPFPHRTLYAGSVTEPFPVRVVAAEPQPSEAATGPTHEQS
ncbi:mechanosensitive ion channel family protein [Geoalkalibacter halelectricus]|uniref:Mechanosensitive ion channel family protein n=1 Tax=Geoalkalibacter halelectricus TaxID=2847045 RepID=A0ABY5ZRW4_9BACT|nr:mechanosensitive ion channel family protein [Geoalkalibacter halelectricus]MDO3377565.1 mechanosensitive ion channel family protein [Geoalkalibacter halelectricus]UWZ80677.1 mechanosensitive ion channel family protein [Geoalkalibacter halelectricus]